MKVFAFFMAIMVLALSVMPCADDARALAHKIAKTEFVKSSQQEECPKTDVCSPFCHCSCCAGFSFTRFTSYLTGIAVFQNTVEAAYLPAEIIEVALPIWQPPQLVS